MKKLSEHNQEIDESAVTVPRSVGQALDRLGPHGQAVLMHVLRAWHEEKVAAGAHPINATCWIVQACSTLSDSMGRPALSQHETRAIQSLLEVQGLGVLPAVPEWAVPK